MGWFFSYSYHSWHTSGDGTIPLHHWLRISLGTRMGGEAKHIHLKSSWDSMGQFACHYCECLSRYIAKVSPLCWMPVTLHISIISVLYKSISSQYKGSHMYKMLETVESAVFFTVCGSVRKTLTMPFDIVNPLLIYTVGEVLVSGHLFVMKGSLGSWLAKVGFYDECGCILLRPQTVSPQVIINNNNKQRK